MVSKSKPAKPDWFPASVHRTGPVTFEHWLRAIVLRLAVVAAPQSPDWKKEHYLEQIQDTGTTYGDPPDASECLAVKSMTPYQAMIWAAIFNRTPELSEVKMLVDREIAGDFDWSDEASRVRSTARTGEATDLPSTHFEFDRFLYKQPVMVDLALDDETIMTGFKVWLRTIRRMIDDGGGQFINKPIDADVLQKWNTFQVLGAFDLITWRELSGADYTDAAIAAWLWPDGSDDYVDRAERLRKVTKPLVEKVMQWPTVEQLMKHWAAEHFVTDRPNGATQDRANGASRSALKRTLEQGQDAGDFGALARGGFRVVLASRGAR